MFKLARLEFEEFLGVLLHVHFQLRCVHLSSQWLVIRHCIPFLDLADVVIAKVLNLETGIISTLSSLLVLKF